MGPLLTHRVINYIPKQSYEHLLPLLGAAAVVIAVLIILFVYRHSHE